jgi:hypothetical protein
MHKEMCVTHQFLSCTKYRTWHPTTRRSLDVQLDMEGIAIQADETLRLEDLMILYTRFVSC